MGRGPSRSRRKKGEGDGMGMVKGQVLSTSGSLIQEDVQTD